MSCTLKRVSPAMLLHCATQAVPSLGLSLDSGEAGCLKEVETGEDKVDMLLDGNDHVGKHRRAPGPDTIKRLESHAHRGPNRWWVPLPIYRPI